MSAKDHLPYDVLDLDGLRDDFAAGRVRQVGVVARRLLATLDAVLSSQGMVRASRPREAGSGAPDEGSKWYTGDGEAFIVLPPNEVRRLRIEAAQSMRAAPVVPITHTVAPEACPVAEKPLAWTAFSESSSWTGVWCKTREGAQERVDEFKRRWPKTGPYRVVPLYAHPASATAEGGDPWQDLRDDVLHNVDGYDNDTVNHYLGVIDYHSPATPASAAGRERAREGARQAFYEAALALAEVIDDHCCEPESRSAAKASATCGEREFAFKEAHNALLAAEAAELGEKEA